MFKKTDPYSREIKKCPKNAKLYFKRGKAYFEKNKYEEALKDFNKTIELNEDYVKAYFMRGSIYWSDDDVEKSVENYEKAVEKDPKFYDAWVELIHGYVYLAHDNKLLYESKFLQAFNKAVEIDAKNEKAYDALVTSYMNEADNDEPFFKEEDLNPLLIDIYTKKIKNRGEENSINDFLQRAVCYANIKEYQKAENDCKEAMKLDRCNSEIYTTLIKIAKIQFGTDHRKYLYQKNKKWVC